MASNVTHTFDRTPAIYAPGEKIRLTVTVLLHDPEPVTGIVTTTTVITLPDGTRSQPVVVTSNYTVDGLPGTATTTVTDSEMRTWKLIDDGGAVSLWETTA